MRKKADLWEELEGKKVRCHVCAHHCVIQEGKRGICRTRENEDGVLYTLIYQSLSSIGSTDPIEKKPLYHFWPGTNAYSIATAGCNFRCKYCQNWQISQCIPDKNGKTADFQEEDKNELGARTFNLKDVPAEEVVKRAKASKCHSIAYTYNEPTIWYEYVRDCSKIAHEEGIKNVLVTNGYSSEQANKEYVKFIDAANVDVKAFNNDFYKKLVGVPSFKPVLKTCEYFKEHDVHVEITNLIIPDENDDLDEIRDLAKWVHDELGPDTPLHFSAYGPRYKLKNPRTSPGILKDAYDVAKDEGLYYVFLGNMGSEKGSNTYCHSCGELLIKRTGYNTKNVHLDEDQKCKNCGEKAFIQGKFLQSSRSFPFL